MRAPLSTALGHDQRSPAGAVKLVRGELDARKERHLHAIQEYRSMGSIGSLPKRWRDTS